ncbi:MAG: DASH family cryptochrome [Planctomycetota bacterium]|jgi:deoxyribodipyrimidine photo-lyase
MDQSPRESVQMVWFRDDLRTVDQPALAAAAAAGPVTAVAVLDPAEYAPGPDGHPRQGAAHARFRLESLADLGRRLADLGGRLHVRVGDPVAIVPAIAAEVGARAVHLGGQPCPEERRQERAVARAIAERRPACRVEIHETAGVLPAGSMADADPRCLRVFARFREAIREHLEAAVPVDAPRRIVPGPAPSGSDVLPSPDAAGLAALGLEPLPDDPRADLRFIGGETAGLARIESWIFEGDHLRSYRQTRDGLVGDAYSSKFSPWLAHGCLGPRTVLEAVRRYERQRTRNDSTQWLAMEVLWREFFRHVARRAGGRLFRAGGLRGLPIALDRDETRCDAWRHGRTGVPLVDASMRQLAATGFLSNRGRQVAASFLVVNLGIDWRMGAAWFQSRLVDHDAASNWGNWAAVAGVGTGRREFSWFDPWWQGRRYDPDAAHARRWLPELAEADAAAIHGVDGDASGGRATRPIVDVAGTAEQARRRHEAAVAAARAAGVDAGPWA